MRKYESEGKYTVRNLVKNKAIALELAEIYVKNRYGQDAAEEEKPYEITELTTSWVVEGTIHSDQIAGNDSNLLIVFYVQIMPDDFVMQLHRF